MQHPSRRNASFGSVEYQYLINIRLAGEFVRWSRKYPSDSIKIITRRKAIARYERRATDDPSH